MILDEAKEIKNNDVYFFEVLKENVLINDNYKGVLIFDGKFKLLKKIRLFDDLTIEFSIKKDNKILLICTENRKIVYFDLNDYRFQIISLEGFEDWTFSPFFEWTENVVVMTDYKGNFAKVDLEKSRIAKINKLNSEWEIILKTYQMLKGLDIYKLFVESKKAIIENSLKERKRSTTECLVK